MDCPKCATTVPAGAAECPGCGVVLAKAADAADRAFLRRQTLAKQQAIAPVPEKKSPWRAIIIIALLAVCAFGAYQWYTDDTTSDLETLAEEIKQSDAPADGRGSRSMRRLWVKFGIAVALFAAGYLRLKQSMSP